MNTRKIKEMKFLAGHNCISAKMCISKKRNKKY